MFNAFLVGKSETLDFYDKKAYTNDKQMFLGK